MQVVNPTADLDAYVVHMDTPAQFGGAALKSTWESISERMRVLMPSAMDELKEELEKARVRERLYSTVAGEVVSDDLLVTNVGVSSEYQSRPTSTSVTWAGHALAVKCGEVDTPQICSWMRRQGRGGRWWAWWAWCWCLWWPKLDRRRHAQMLRTLPRRSCQCR